MSDTTTFWVWADHGPAVEIDAESTSAAAAEYAERFSRTGSTYVASDVVAYVSQIVTLPV